MTEPGVEGQPAPKEITEVPQVQADLAQDLAAALAKVARLEAEAKGEGGTLPPWMQRRLDHMTVKMRQAQEEALQSKASIEVFQQRVSLLEGEVARLSGVPDTARTEPGPAGGSTQRRVGGVAGTPAPGEKTPQEIAAEMRA